MVVASVGEPSARGKEGGGGGELGSVGLLLRGTVPYLKRERDI